MRSTSMPRRLLSLAAALLFLPSLQGCTLVGGPGAPAPEASGASPAWTQTGVASWYGEPFHGRTTASGEIYDMEALTCAHPSLPFGTVLLVENLVNGRSIRLRVNDRGPFKKGRILDVSRRAAQELGMIGPGTTRVRITVVEAGRWPDLRISRASPRPPSVHGRPHRLPPRSPRSYDVDQVRQPFR